ncbi:ATP-binding protein [Streptosporangium sp. NPDC087985]|uniref:ATP-binding protein n=1 Tax=Streptosporangium sp. NPDC087985 TaxID=3366196 RepID=UPI003819F850
MSTTALSPAACRYERHQATTPRWATLRLLGHAEFPATPTAVATARQWIRDLLTGRTSAPTLDDAILLLSEIMTNAVIHSDSGRTPNGSVMICIGTDIGTGADGNTGKLHLEVIDDGSATNIPFIRAADTDSDGGRGLLLVDLIATDWGTHHDHETGNAVWFHLTDHAPGHHHPR